MNSLLAWLIGLMSGAAMSVAVSCVWIVLLIPSRIQDRFQACSPKSLTWALALGLIFSALSRMLGVKLPLPDWLGALLIIPCGMFVGMLSAALGEILEVAPVLMRRFRLGDVSTGMRWVIMLAKGLGAVLASLVFTL